MALLLVTPFLAMTTLIAVSFAGPDHRGKEFFLAYPQTTSGTQHLKLLITNPGRYDVTVQVTAPKWLAANLHTTVTVKPGAVSRVTFTASLSSVGTALSSKAIHVLAQDEVVVTAVESGDSMMGTFLALPADVLGTEYFAVTYSPTWRCQVTLVGTEDNTAVDILLSSEAYVIVKLKSTSVYHGGQTFQIIVNKFDTFMFQSTGDLTGTKINSSKPVSVFSGNVKTVDGGGVSYDNMVEQLAPTNAWGTHFILTPTPNRPTGELVKIVCCRDNTSISLDPPLPGFLTESRQIETVLLAKAGDHLQLLLPSETYSSLTSSEPVQVSQIVVSQTSQLNEKEADPAMTLVPPVYHWMSGYQFAAPFLSTPSFNNFVTVVVESSQRAGLLLNGGPIALLGLKWTAVGNTTLVASSFLTKTSVYHMQHILPNVSFQCVLYGKTLSQGYGFPAGMRMVPLLESCEPSVSTKGDGLDNDCDGLVDEDLCEDSRHQDNDKQGGPNEDCAAVVPINGGWSSWSRWSDCRSILTRAIRTRNRVCNSPPTKFGGRPCIGSRFQISSVCKSDSVRVSTELPSSYVMSTSAVSPVMSPVMSTSVVSPVMSSVMSTSVVSPVMSSVMSSVLSTSVMSPVMSSVLSTSVVSPVMSSVMPTSALSSAVTLTSGHSDLSTLCSSSLAETAHIATSIHHLVSISSALSSPSPPSPSSPPSPPSSVSEQFTDLSSGADMSTVVSSSDMVNHISAVTPSHSIAVTSSADIAGHITVVTPSTDLVSHSSTPTHDGSSPPLVQTSSVVTSPTPEASSGIISPTPTESSSSDIMTSSMVVLPKHAESSWSPGMTSSLAVSPTVKTVYPSSTVYRETSSVTPTDSSIKPLTLPRCTHCVCPSRVATTTPRRPQRSGRQSRDREVRALILDRKLLSSAVRRKTSASDPRLSCRVMGVSSSLVIVAIVIVVCSLDCPTKHRSSAGRGGGLRARKA